MRSSGRDPTRYQPGHLLLGVLGCMLLPGPLLGQESERDGGSSIEYQVKAAYLLNFTRYVEWPPSMFSSPTAPIHLCVLGDDPFGADLDRATADKSSDGHPIRVRRTRERAQLDGCHLVFVSEREGHRNPDVAKQLTRDGVLTVGDNAQFAENGGVIGFVIQDETVRFVVNLDAQDRAGVRISSRVLSLASSLIPSHGS